MLGRNGGRGWAAPWGDADTQNSTAEIRFAGKAYGDSVGLPLPGGLLEAPYVYGSSEGYKAISRPLRQPVRGDLWLRFTAANPTAESRAGVTLVEPRVTRIAENAVVLLGDELLVRYDDVFDRSTRFNLGHTHEVVAHLVVRYDDVDALRVWLDPGEGPLGQPDFTRNDRDAFGDAVDVVGITAYWIDPPKQNIETTAGGGMSELVFAESYEALRGVVKPPTE